MITNWRKRRVRPKTAFSHFSHVHWAGLERVLRADCGPGAIAQRIYPQLSLFHAEGRAPNIACRSLGQGGLQEFRAIICVKQNSMLLFLRRRIEPGQRVSRRENGGGTIF